MARTSSTPGPRTSAPRPSTTASDSWHRAPTWDYGWRGGGWQLHEAHGDFTPFETFDDGFGDFGGFGGFGGFEGDDWGDFGGGGFGGGGFGGGYGW
jgi:hypothetical protein